MNKIIYDFTLPWTEFIYKISLEDRKLSLI